MNTLTLQKAYNLYLRLNRLVTNWPKKERYNLGLRTEDFSLSLLEKIIAAEQSPPVLKDRSLLEANVKNETIKLLLRMSLEKELLRETDYFSLSQELIEIGKMISGWRKSIVK